MVSVSPIVSYNKVLKEISWKIVTLL